MQKRFLLICFVIASTHVCAQDEWLGADLKGGFFGIRYADYEDSGRNIALSATLPAVLQSEFHLAYSDYRDKHEGGARQSQAWNIHWNTDPYAAASFGLGVSTSGTKSELEIRDYSLHAQYLTESFWRFRGEVIIGQAEISDTAIPSLIAEDFRLLGLNEIDREGLNLAVSYDSTVWGGRVGFAVYHHDQNGNASQSQLNTLDQQISDQSASLIQYYLALVYGVFRRSCADDGVADALINSCIRDLFDANEEELRVGLEQWQSDYIAYNRAENHKNLLSDHEVSADVYWLVGRSTLVLGVFAYQSYIEEELFTQSYAEWRYALSDRLTLGVLLGYSDNQSQLWSEASFGWSW